ncbi:MULTISPECIES: DUF2231 domain-containing protein [Mycobacterium]|uniref:DUF2231 domain-containing protein n=1 Tax=Mycobacterium gordonae TaxID=1778 RepID=A0A1A6BHG1_MYCGO|nr:MULTISPECIES: DUF2231 domain-containing protein [Mycobacterium]MBI2698414.1 DUF2231 domain-containing protein [Mycobacterium sp.]MBX9980284.1 DUF2231 domain-containing protein [Mycobacterium gordonae]MCQ4362312.1 DUF2231 domain-containing protein [Mycobacterium gordonae]MCV7006151.1 DUF2231 domain-containing protein [Mycobacterium gordonae]OBS01782.1 DUF2231 domain-containing protein [Mycobacterium gordonae]
MNLHRALSRVEDFEVLDGTTEAASHVADQLLGRRGLGGALRGSWLGHPVHPLLITLPIGAWLTSAVLDVVFKDATAARRLVAIGLAATPPTVLAGWADYPLLNRRQQRVGLVHAASNGVGVVMFSLSYRSYRKERYRAARMFTVLGLTAISAGGALGGHLSYAQGAGMFRWQPLRAVTNRSAAEHRRAA